MVGRRKDEKGEGEESAFPSAERAEAWVILGM